MSHCVLCETDLPRHPIVDGEQAFCCPGCHAVFRILEAKGELDGFSGNPIFRRAIESGLISNPQLLEEIRRQKPKVSQEQVQKLYLEIQDMWCPSCAEVLRLMLLKHTGVVNCVVDYATDLACIEFNPMDVGKDDLIEVITGLGYGASNIQDNIGKPVTQGLTLRFGVAAFCALNIMMFSYPIYASYFHGDDTGLVRLLAWTSLGFALPVLGYSAWPIWRRFISSVRVGIFGMETLVTLGISAAFGLSLWELLSGGHHVYFDSMSTIIVFVLLGKMIESKAKFSAKESLFRLTRSIPRRGRKRLENGNESFVSLKEVSAGDTLVAYSGEKVVLDGIVSDGAAAIDESLMTGESLPVSKARGDTVLGGTCLQSGSISYRVTASSEQSALQRIIDMVEQKIDHKTHYVRAADRIVRWFVPCIVALAFSTAWLLILFGGDPSTAVVRAVSILLISCPCAIGIAAPLAESLLMHGLASMGAIIRNRGCLNDLGRETAFVFDKTGTITEGLFRVLSGLDRESPILRGMVRQSIHPISVAIARELGEGPYIDEAVEELTGLGLRCEVNGSLYLLGSEKLLKQQGIWVAESTGPHTTVYFARDGAVVATIELGDAVREEAKEVVRRIRDARCYLLSGDCSPAVELAAISCGFDQWQSACSPLDKREFIETLRAEGQRVAMVGDGINDAPCLTGANVGISVVSAADISVQVSDVLLTTERLSVIPRIRSLACKGRRIIQQNLFWAFFYNVIGIGLAMTGHLSPLFASFAMIASSLIVIANALRLK